MVKTNQMVSISLMIQFILWMFAKHKWVHYVWLLCIVSSPCLPENTFSHNFSIILLSFFRFSPFILTFLLAPKGKYERKGKDDCCFNLSTCLFCVLRVSHSAIVVFRKEEFPIAMGFLFTTSVRLPASVFPSDFWVLPRMNGTSVCLPSPFYGVLGALPPTAGGKNSHFLTSHSLWFFLGPFFQCLFDVAFTYGFRSKKYKSSSLK